MVKNFFCLLVLLGNYLAWPSYLEAQVPTQNQTCGLTISGKVLDQHTGIPLPAATLRLDKVSQIITSDLEGNYHFHNLCPGQYEVQVSYVGFDEYKFLLDLRASVVRNIRLHPSGDSLHAVEITGHRSPIQSTTTVNTLTQQDLERSKGGTLANILTAVPGVTMLQTGATIAKPVIHGMHSNRILTLNNGIRQEGQQWGAEHAPEIDPFIAQQITVVKGAEAVRFGPEAIGGVIIVEPPVLPQEAPVHGEANLVGTSNGRSGIVSGMLNGGLKQIPGLGWRVQGTLKKVGNLKTADYFLGNTGVRENNYSAALGYTNTQLGIEGYYSHFNTSLGIFRGAHIGNLSDLISRIEHSRPFEEDQFSYTIEAPRQLVSHDLLKLKGHVHLTEHTKLNVLYGLQRNTREEYDIRRGGREGLPSIDLALTSHTLDINLEQNSARGWKTILGLNGIAQVNNNVPGTQATPLIPNYDTNGGGLYTIGRLVKEKYELEGGLRYDYRYLDALGYNREGELYGGRHRFHNISGSLGILRNFSSYWNIRSNLGLAWRPPTVNELYSDGLHHGVAAVERGDADLVSEQSFKWINTLSYQKERLRLELTAYANIIQNYIYLQPSLELWESSRGSFPIYNYRQTNARFLGADLLLNCQVSKALAYELKGSMVRVKDITTNTFLPWIPTDRLENSIKWQGGHRQLQDTYVQLQHIIVARQTRYEPNSDFAPPPGAYQLLNFTAGTKWVVARQAILMNISINNLTNTLYKDYMNRFRYYAHDTGRNIVLRLTYRF